MSVQTTLERNLERVRQRIADAAVRVGRDPQAIELVAVTKDVTAERAAELHGLGLSDLGENRADELALKAAYFGARGLVARWHFIGHLQTNKVRRVVERAHAIHSIDSERLLENVERIAADVGREPQLYLQVKLAHGTERTGAAPGELAALVERAADCAHVRLVGVMAMAPIPAANCSNDTARAVFDAAVRIARELERDPRTARAFVGGRVRTSLGMSQDFEVAVAAGADLVRIGSLFFEGLSQARTSEAERA